MAESRALRVLSAQAGMRAILHRPRFGEVYRKYVVREGTRADDVEWMIACFQRVVTADAYYCAEQISTQMQAIARELPLSATLVPEDLPTPNGYCLFETPVSIPVEEDTRTSYMGIGWVTNAPRDLDWTAPPSTIPTDITVVFFSGAEDMLLSVPTSLLPWPFSSTIADNLRNLQKNEASLGDSRNIPYDTRRYQFILAFFRFLRDRITLQSERVPHEEQHRLRQKGMKTESTVRVLLLREAANDRDSSSREDRSHIDWQHQWIVGSHIRKQWYPKAGVHKPKLIAPYRKGPKDKPLKEKPVVVRAITR